jgi:hypothetical protein
VAAGASADVTWFPRVAAAGGGASTTNAEWFIARRTSNLTMLAATTETIVWSDLHSSDSSLFSLSNVDRPNDSVAVAREGVVLFNAWALAGALEPNFVMGLVLNSSNGVSMNTNTPQNQYNTKGATPPTLFGPAQTAIVIPDAVPYQVYAEYDNLDAVNHVLATSQMWGLWWPTGALSPF